MRGVVRLAVVVCCIGVPCPIRAQVAINGALSGEIRTFPQPPGVAGQDVTTTQPTVTGETTLEVARLPKGFVATFNPYFRYDTIDSGRSVFDLHELNVSG